jgi:hypothetical protein
VREHWSEIYRFTCLELTGSYDYVRIRIKRVADSNETSRSMVDNWLTDVKRRGTELYASNEGDEVQYFSFEGKDHFRFSVEVDHAVQDITVQITDPKTGGLEIEELALTAKNLDAIARLMCIVKEGEAVVPVYLLAQLAVICHGYQRLIEELDKIHGIQTTTGSVRDIEADLRRFLTPEEQKRTDNPLLTQKSKGAG